MAKLPKGHKKSQAPAKLDCFELEACKKNEAKALLIKLRSLRGRLKDFVFNRLEANS